MEMYASEFFLGYIYNIIGVVNFFVLRKYFYLAEFQAYYEGVTGSHNNCFSFSSNTWIQRAYDDNFEVRISIFKSFHFLFYCHRTVSGML